MRWSQLMLFLESTLEIIKEYDDKIVKYKIEVSLLQFRHMVALGFCGF